MRSYRHYIAIGITAGFICCSVFIFPNALGRVIESCRDLTLSAAYYFVELFGIDNNIKPTVNSLPVIPFFRGPADPAPPFPSVPLPDDYVGFKEKWLLYWRLWASRDNLFLYIIFILNLLYVISQTVLIIIPLALTVILLFRRYLNLENNDYNRDSLPLKIFKRVSSFTYRPVKHWLSGFISFIRDTPLYWKLWLSIWLFNFNILTILIEFIAFYLYFIVSFDVLNIYRQFYKLFIDLMPMIRFVPVAVWILLAFVLFDRFRKNIGYSRLRQMERRNCGFINERPIVILQVGTMGVGKTKMVTDMALSQEVMLRDKALEKLRENDMKFPNFPWINFENILKKAMHRHIVYNLSTCKRLIRHLQACYTAGLADKAVFKSCRRHLKKYLGYDFSNLIFDYDTERYGDIYDDGLKIVGLFDVLKSYSQLYFIYVIQTTLIISNYSIRSDNIFIDKGNFPIIDGDFFARSSREIDGISKNAHIIDFDAFRLGKKLVENNPNKDFFEFGVVVITEVGKERGNTKELENVKKTAEETNQKNDLFNIGLKMIRHPSTIDGFPFVKVITDDQRAMSWGADARDLCEIVHIRKLTREKLSMPFFDFEELAYGWLYSRFERMYSKYRHLRGDNTLFMYLLKGMITKFNNYYKRVYNTFAYDVLQIQIERGTMDSKFLDRKYFISHKKIYSKRYATDCYGEYYERKVLRSKVGLADIPAYKSERAAFEELKQQNSYFINDLVNIENQKDTFKKRT